MVNYSLLNSYLSDVDTTAISDGNKALRVLSSEIKLRSREPRMCGPAYTVRARRDFFAVALAIERARAGSVIVVDGGGEDIAFAGELFARAAKMRHIAGIIIDGGYRDIGYVSSCDLPIYSRFVTPMAGTTRDLGESNVPITCGGVSVSPEDVVIGDREGVVILSPHEAIPLVEGARKVKEAEMRVIKNLQAGNSLSDCLNIAEHAENLEKGEPSSLKFLI